MTMPRHPPHRHLLSAALGASVAAAVVLTTSGFPDRIAAGSPGAAAATATALVPADIRVVRRTEAPRPRTDAATERSGVLLYFLMEAARPQPLFAR